MRGGESFSIADALLPHQSPSLMLRICDMACCIMAGSMLLAAAIISCICGSGQHGAGAED